MYTKPKRWTELAAIAWQNWFARRSISDRSIMKAPGHLSHSADVRIQLSVNGRVFAVAQLGPDFLVLRDAVELPPTDWAEIALTIDGNRRHWPVKLLDGISASQRKTRIQELEAHLNGSAH